MLELHVRTPLGLALSTSALSVRAEDQSGWFGLLPGRSSLVAALLPGLLIYRDREGEGYLAHAGGLLDLNGLTCRVMTPYAVASRDVSTLADEIERLSQKRKTRSALVSDVLGALAREAYLRAAQEAPS